MQSIEQTNLENRALTDAELEEITGGGFMDTVKQQILPSSSNGAQRHNTYRS